jgi:RimJ/RimL family protein N-acetyltransferase
MTPDESFLDVTCPQCRETLSFPQEGRASVRECPSCGESVLVPANPGEPGGRIPLPISTPRLVLRRLSGSDWKYLLEFLSDEELFRYGGVAMDEAHLLQWLEADAHVRLTTPRATFSLGMELQARSKVVGVLHLDFADEACTEASLRIYVHREFQRQDLATEAVNAVLEFCFGKIGLHRLTAACDSRNAAALGLCARTGLRREGQFRKNRFVNGEWSDTVWHAMLEEDYFNAAQAPPPRGAS